MPQHKIFSGSWKFKVDQLGTCNCKGRRTRSTSTCVGECKCDSKHLSTYTCDGTPSLLLACDGGKMYVILLWMKYRKIYFLLIFHPFYNKYYLTSYTYKAIYVSLPINYESTHISQYKRTKKMKPLYTKLLIIWLLRFFFFFQEDDYYINQISLWFSFWCSK